MMIFMYFNGTASALTEGVAAPPPLSIAWPLHLVTAGQYAFCRIEYSIFATARYGKFGFQTTFRALGANILLC